MGSTAEFGSLVNEVGDLTGGSVFFVLDENGNLVASTDSVSGENAVADVSYEIDEATGLLSVTYEGTENATEDMPLNFLGGKSLGKVNADFSKSSGNFDVNIGNIPFGEFVFSEASKIAAVFSGLKNGAQITMSGGANDDNPDSGNTYYATADGTVASADDQAVVTITDISFNATDVVKVDAGIANLTADFFGTGQFFNYANAAEASTTGVYAGTVLDASDLVASAGMSFSMLRMADGTATLDDENAVSESSIVNVVWANTGSAAEINFADQTGEVLLFTNTNGTYGDAVTLGGEFNDTIHAGANDTILAGAGDDIVYVGSGATGKNAYIDAGAGNDTVYAGRGTHITFDSDASGDDVIYGFVAGTNSKAGVIEFTGSSVANASINSSGQLVLSSENGTATVSLESGNFTGSTSFELAIGGQTQIARVADASGNLYYDKNATYYAGTGSTTLTVNTGRSTEIDLSEDMYSGVANVNASNASGKVDISGDSGDNALYGGAKASTLWGGGGNDTLFGGDGKDTFVFTATDGNVTIQNGASNDVVDMTSFTINDIASYDFTNTGLVITTTNDQTLTINGTNLTTFNLNGGTYTADYANGSFIAS